MLWSWQSGVDVLEADVSEACLEARLWFACVRATRASVARGGQDAGSVCVLRVMLSLRAGRGKVLGQSGMLGASLLVGSYFLAVTPTNGPHKRTPLSDHTRGTDPPHWPS